MAARQRTLPSSAAICCEQARKAQQKESNEKFPDEFNDIAFICIQWTEGHHRPFISLYTSCVCARSLVCLACVNELFAIYWAKERRAANNVSRTHQSKIDR